MIRIRTKLERLNTATYQVLEHLPLLHRVALAPLVESLFSIITDLTEEIDKLKHGGSSNVNH